ncbi:MAG: hypothetical protein HGB35_03905 [Geobacteraceae bacterium]|nr:hypothetical protein [Geobacteraceae bacterium]
MEKQLVDTLEPDGRVLVSFSQRQAEGFRAERILFDRVEGMVRFKGNYSATAFRDGYRDGDHALQGQELIILDFDDRYSIGEAMVDFAEYVGLIATTRNHLREKHGVVAERFRVILPTDKPIMLEREAFKLMMAEVMARFVHADPACKNIDRMYYGFPEAEIFYLNGARLFAWEGFYQAAIVRQSERNLQQKGRVRRPDSEASCQKSYMTFFQKWFVPGNRNNALFQLACWMRDDGVVELERLLLEMNNGSGCPLEEEEVQRILRRLQ